MRVFKKKQDVRSGLEINFWSTGQMDWKMEKKLWLYLIRQKAFKKYSGQWPCRNTIPFWPVAGVKFQSWV